MTWSTRAFLGEVLRSLTSRALSAAILVAVFSGTALAAGWTEMVAWRDDARLAAAQQASGSLVIRATTSDPSESISTAACRSLAHVGGVRAAGGVASGSVQYASTSPGLGFRVLPATGQIVAALTGADPGDVSRPGLVVADALAEQLGLAARSNMVVGGTATTVAAVAPLGQRDPQLGRVALSLAAPPPALTACYIEFADDYSLGTLSTQLPAIFADTAHLKLDRLFAVGRGNPDPAALWNERFSRLIFLPLGALGALVHALVVRGLRQEYSVYLVTGSRRRHVAFMVLLSGCLISCASAAIALSWLALAAYLSDVPVRGLQFGVRAAAGTVVTAAVLMPLSILWLARANLHRLLRERGS